MLHEYAAIDPMALLFPSRLYIELSEKLHPHLPKPIEIKEALGPLTPEERKYILVRARMLSSYSKVVEEAIGSSGGKPRSISQRRRTLGLVPGQISTLGAPRKKRNDRR